MAQCTIKGVDCPNCASQLSDALVRAGAVRRAHIDITADLLIYEGVAGRAEPETRARMISVVRRCEPGVTLRFGGQEADAESAERGCGCDHSHAGQDGARGHAHDHVEEDGGAHDGDRAGGARGVGVLWARVGVALALLIACAALPLPAPLRTALLLCAYALAGYDVLYRALRNTLRGRLFDENFLMAIATVGAIALGDYAEAVGVMVFYQVGEYFQNAALRRSMRSIRALMDIRPDRARVLRGGRETLLPAQDVAVGENIVIWPGERVPLDSEVTDGRSQLDTSALTGESVPREVGPGGSLLSGAVNKSAVLTARVQKPFAESTMSRILDMVQNAAAQKAPTEQFITRFSRVYTPLVIALAALLAAIPPLLFGQPFAMWLNRALVFLVVSCPCALVISIPLGFFSGIGACSRRGVLVKGGNYLEALARLHTLVFDKTGTLTKGALQVTDVRGAQGVAPESLLAIAAACERFSTHPVAKAIAAAGESGLSAQNVTEHAGLGVSALVDGEETIVGAARLLNDRGVACPQESEGAVHVARGGQYLGYIVVADELKSGVQETLLALRRAGVRRMAMLTGDRRAIALRMAEGLPLDEVHADLLPGGKVERLQAIMAGQEKGAVTAFVGDGINDAPVLASADVGIAMGALGSDAAIEAADIVLMTDDIGRLPDAMRIARETRRVVAFNIAMALSVKAAVLLLGALGLAGMWMAVFADVGVALVATLIAAWPRK